ncbi:hypothetical protein PLICRDRAFT_117752, partial [Plicaturopsis crispa FD-325 SS-3]
GPKPLPIIGNLLQIPTRHEAQVYQQWGRDFNSDILHLNLAGTSVVIINSATIANELLEQRSLIYSSRPASEMCKLMGFGNLLVLLPYGDTWRAMRRLLQREFSPHASLQYSPLVVEATHDFLRRLLESPDEFSAHTVHTYGRIIMDITYGIKVDPKGDPRIEMAKLVVDALGEAASPGAFYVESFPFLKHVPEWMPGAGFKRKAREWHLVADEMYNKPFNTTKEDIARGVSTPSFVANCLEPLQNDDALDKERQEQLIKEAAGTMYAAGTDTTASTVKAFFLAMLLYPEVQAKAQKELDEVVGHGNLPNFSHQDSLPYVDAIIKESLRWKPVAPQGIPHVLTTEDAYEGYRIPAGTIVLPNEWAILHNEAVYPNPSTFSPERFLDSEGHIDRSVKDPAFAAFGFGRRICPGRYLAMSSLYIAIASILATFNVEKATDADGVPITPSGECMPSGVVV